jgi:predicted nucleotidyltransferase
MATINEYIDVLRNFKQQHGSEYGIKRMGIFGSTARGTHTPDSDLDICVEIQKPDMFVLIGIKDDLQNIFNKKVDIIRLRKNMNPLLLETINKTAIYA